MCTAAAASLQRAGERIAPGPGAYHPETTSDLAWRVHGATALPQQHRNCSFTPRRRRARVVVQRSHDVTPHRQQLAVEQTLGQKAAAANQARATAHLTSFATGNWSHSSNQGHRRVVPRENDGRGAARDQRHAAHRPQPAAAAAAAQAALHCGATAPCSFVPLLHLR